MEDRTTAEGQRGSPHRLTTGRKDTGSRWAGASKVKLTDLMAGRIIDQVIKPRFQQGDFDGGFRTGVSALIDGTRGEFTTEQRPGKRRQAGASPFPDHPSFLGCFHAYLRQYIPYFRRDYCGHRAPCLRLSCRPPRGDPRHHFISLSRFWRASYPVLFFRRVSKGGL